MNLAQTIDITEEKAPMRAKIRQQLAIVEPSITHQHSDELEQMGLLLDKCPEVLDLVYADLIVGLIDPETGRNGMMTAEQVLRAMLIKQMNSFSYEELSFHLADSRSYRRFCGVGFADEIPSSSTLQRDIKKIRVGTLESKALGVKDVCFHKKCGIKIAEMAKSTWVYKRLRNFRAGIEGSISYLKRSFGLRRCTWSGLRSFKAYAWASVITANLLLMSRHLLA